MEQNNIENSDDNNTIHNSFSSLVNLINNRHQKTNNLFSKIKKYINLFYFVYLYI